MSTGDAEALRKPPPAMTVAIEMIGIARRRRESLTHHKLQKLLYYAYSWYLAETGQMLFDELITAGTHGPYVRSVYRQFRQFGDRDLTTIGNTQETTP